jgi:hypothetical protein
MRRGIAVTLILVFFSGASSAVVAGVFSELTDKQIREANRGRTVGEQIKSILR